MVPGEFRILPPSSASFLPPPKWSFRRRSAPRPGWSHHSPCSPQASPAVRVLRTKLQSFRPSLPTHRSATFASFAADRLCASVPVAIAPLPASISVAFRHPMQCRDPPADVRPPVSVRTQRPVLGSSSAPVSACTPSQLCVDRTVRSFSAFPCTGAAAPSRCYCFHNRFVCR